MPPRKINLVQAADQKITKVFDPHIAGDVNDSQGISILEMASKLLSEEAEAQAGLSRGPFLRKYMHR